jgi:MFS family permease
LALRDPAVLDSWAGEVRPVSLINSSAEFADAQRILPAMFALREDNQPIDAESLLSQLGASDASPEQREHWTAYLSGEPTATDGPQLADRIAARATALDGRLNKWIGLLSMMLNIGGFFGIYCFGLVTQRIGRRGAFAIAFLIAWATTILVFWQMDGLADVFWMIPLMGFGVLSPFGGYAIYFPELFPTRLRSTGTSFCYNVGRFVAALGPSALGLLTAYVYRDYDEPMRYAGVTMCGIFLLGLAVLPFAPETRGKPLPE